MLQAQIQLQTKIDNEKENGSINLKKHNSDGKYLENYICDCKNSILNECDKMERFIKQGAILSSKFIHSVVNHFDLLQYAIQIENEEIIDRLVKYNFDFDYKNSKNGDTTLIMALICGKHHLKRLLLLIHNEFI